jgi:membrane fusion protein, macrolide-specific efflux system
MRRKLLAIAVLVALGVGALAISVGGVGAQATATNDYLTSEASVGDITDQVAATGSLAAATTYGLVFGAPPYLDTTDAQAPTSTQTWPVSKVAVKPGDHVTAGQALATADTVQIRREISRATADLDAADLQRKIAKEQLADARDAEDQTAIRQALLQVYSTRNQASKASEDRETLRAALRAATIRSPIDGVVTEVNVSASFDAPAGPAIVVASDEMTVTTNVVEGDLADIQVGQAASVTLDAIGETVDGSVTAISPVAADDSNGVVAYPVTVTLTKPPAKARGGMSADVAITVASATNVVTVPVSALQGTTGDYAVMTLAADGTPQRVPVDVGLVTNASAEIKSGLEAGTPVVIGTTADLIGTQSTGRNGFGGVGIPGGVVRRIDGGGPVTNNGNQRQATP